MKQLTHYDINTPPQRTRSCVIGLPSSMMFYEHGRLWEEFFRKLDCSVVKSGPTSREIMDIGVSLCSSETCLPVKVFTGHVASLAKQADYIFIPRYTTMAKYEMTCPKFCALPDMVRLNLHDNVKLIEVDIDLAKGMDRTEASLQSLSHELGRDYGDVKRAFLSTVRYRLKTDMEAGLIEPEVQNKKSIAVLGHPYMIYDELLSMTLISKLKRKSYQVVTPDSLGFAARREQFTLFSGRNFYEVGSDILGSAFAFMTMPQVKGIIYLSPFACGVDSLATEFIERHLRREDQRMPFMKVTVDEHTGEAGFDTRLEAFLDMIEE